ncbi:hypothetical protein, partial [Barnesiella intestinihominis]|uniref:hypothetical protein n=3 Tax=Barnesiella intestinihominis TaxID=487174 RepID=UPI00388F38B6
PAMLRGTAGEVSARTEGLTHTAKKTYEIFPISLLKNYRSVGISPIATATQGMQSIAFVKIPAYPLGFSTEPLL